ncbi:ABC transporter permease subunit [Streptomyces yaanensis]|uniref:ABC transporter permease subunit n=1 Tax=Streptomyces yaanensis TaxID=1142239 RepID=A0ABV7SNZ8_9ACTN|nr:ABC transporter permease subunit [Streptomyces sp. CGMCC 4.7035]WNB97185.1 ABC transporter permease subunit [Streptomyces sp. CGMCC 4.7035]
MSTLTSSVDGKSDHAPEPRPRFADLLAAEWIKMRSLRSTYWVLALSALAAIVINVNAVHNDLAYIDGQHPVAAGLPPFRYDPLWHGLNKIAADLMGLAAAAFGAITVFGEFATGMIRTTFAAVPDRRAVITAKVAMVTTITIVLGAIVSTASFFLTNAMLASRHLGLSIHDRGCTRAVAAYALIAPVCALLGMAFGAVLRHATASITGVVGMLFLLPMLFGGDRYKLLKEIGDYLPLQAASRLTLNPAFHISLGKYPATISGSWIALAAWSLASVIVAVVVVRRRDV